MASSEFFLEFTIYLTNKRFVDDIVAEHPDGIRISPEEAAEAYSAPIQLNAAPFTSPSVRSKWIVVAAQIDSNDNNFPTSQAYFERSSGGWFGLSSLFGRTVRYIWVGKWAYAPDTTATVDGDPVTTLPVAQIRWLEGFEATDDMEVANSGTSVPVSREASRHVDGMGWFCHENANHVVFTNASGLPATGYKTWERFYFKMVAAPDASARMWRCHVAAGASRGVQMEMTPDRRLRLDTLNDSGIVTTGITTAEQFELGQWYRVDLLLESKPAATQGGNIRLFINGSQKLNYVCPNSNGLSAGGFHQDSRIGMANSVSNTFRCYFDDWTGAEWPQGDGTAASTGIDWLNGTRVRAISSTAFASGNGWTGDWRYAHQYVANPGVNLPNKITSIVSGDVMALVMDSTRFVAEGAIGVFAFAVCWFGRQTVAGNGTLGWRYNGVTDLALHNEGSIANNSWSRRYYVPTGLTAPIPNLTPFELHKVKAANVNLADCFGATVVVQMLGAFGPEDINEDDEDQPTAAPTRRNLHSCNYPDTIYPTATLAPQAPVIVHSGTYVGTGTFIDLFFRAPVTFLYVRRAGAASLATMWQTGNVGGYVGGSALVAPGLPAEARIDNSFVPVGTTNNPEQRTVFRITGNGNDYNSLGVTYQYVAFEDPAGRYSQHGVYYLPNTPYAAGGTIPLDNASFTPLWAFVHPGTSQSTGSTYGRWIKGPGNSVNGATLPPAAEAGSALTFNTGSLGVLGSLATPNVYQAPYSLWRMDDLSDDAHKLDVIRIGSYVGDGAASRTITYGLSGRRPLLAVIAAATGTAPYSRSPGDTGSNSYALTGSGAVSTTAITAGGIDSFTVGLALNANGVSYSYWVLNGSSTAGNNGWSIDGEFAIVEPEVPSGSYVEPPDPTEPVDPVEPNPNPGPTDEDDCEDGEVCVAATTRVANIALSRIGVSKQLDNYCTDATTEARLVRTVYEACVRSTLRDFPWPFATRYATLALAVVQPTHEDWNYSYRQPIDCIFERRLVVARGAAKDPTPPPFENSSDSSGGLIFTNEANAVLEYTARPDCVAFAGDELFRDALEWKIAGAVAPTLTRMTDISKMCEEKYLEAIAKAREVIKPGVPGLRTTPDPSGPDITAPAIAANVAVVNRALLRIGAKTVANLTTEQSPEAVAAAMIFEDELRSTLRDYSWGFARRYDSALVLVGGTSTVPVNTDFQYSYRLPADYVKVRRLVTEGSKRAYDPQPPKFLIGSDATGPLLFTDETEPNLEYTARINAAVWAADDLFNDAFAWRLAAALAPSVAQQAPEKVEQHGRGPEPESNAPQTRNFKLNEAQFRRRVASDALTMYYRVLDQARSSDANEQQQDDPPDAEWISGRN